MRDLPPRDRAHVWTVDRHLVEAAAYAARLTTRVARPDLLLVGALLHDIGKGRGGDHSVVGESVTQQIARRLGFGEPDVAVLGAMVAHHLLLPHTATRRDLDDPATITRVVETLAATDGARKVDGGTGLLLDLLEALAEADSLATGPGRVEPVEADAAGRAGAPLPGRAGRASGSAASPSEPVAPGAGRRRSPRAGARRCGSPGGSRPTVLVVVADGPGVALGRGGGARPALAGGARGRAGDRDRARRRADGAGPPVAVLRLTVSPRFGGLPDPALLRAELGRVLDGTLALGEALARKERDYAPVLPPGEVRRAAAGAVVRRRGDRRRGAGAAGARTGSGCCTGWPRRWRSATRRSGGRGWRRWARRSSTPSASAAGSGGRADGGAAPRDRAGGARGGPLTRASRIGRRMPRRGGRTVTGPAVATQVRAWNEPPVPDVDRA